MSILVDDEAKTNDMLSGLAKSEKLVRTLFRANNQPKDILDNLADFIEIILEKEEKKSK